MKWLRLVTEINEKVACHGFDDDDTYPLGFAFWCDLEGRGKNKAFAGKEEREKTAKALY